MDITDRILCILRESGEAVSGEAIAERLGVSRGWVWKAVKRLREAGYQIEAGTNRGYRLTAESGAFTPEAVRRQVLVDGLELELRGEVSSTNTVLKELAEQGRPEGTVLIAENQVRGKGRLGRSFFSPKGSGLYMSVLLRPELPAEESLAITTAAAVAVAEAVNAVTGRQAMIKWVNDVYLDGRKICGILTEAAIDFENRRLNYAVLGIGVNIQEPPGGFPPELAGTAGALYKADDTVPSWARTKLAAEILNRFFPIYRALPSRGYMDEYKRLSLLTGLEIAFQQGRESWEGTVLGIDDQARLIVRLASGEERAFGAGEASIVKNSLFESMHKKEHGEFERSGINGAQ